MAYVTGPSVASSSTQTSQPEPSSQRLGVSRRSPPGSLTQLQRTLANPPSCRCRAAPVTASRESASPAEPAVAVGELVHRRDDEGRIRDDEPELLVPNGLEQVALPPLDVLDAVQSCVEPGEAECARVQVDADDVLAVARCEERLDAGAGAEVEGGLHRPAHGQRGERPRGRPDLEDVVLPAPGRRAVRRDDEPFERLESRTARARRRREWRSGPSARARAGRPPRARCAAAATGRLSRARKRRTSTERGSSASGPQPERGEPVVESQAAVVAHEPVDAVLVVADTLQALAELRERLGCVSVSLAYVDASTVLARRMP